MSDGMMLEGRPIWSPEWFHHETFHIMEHIFPGNEMHLIQAPTVCLMISSSHPSQLTYTQNQPLVP